jgi:hypothetical protein
VTHLDVHAQADERAVDRNFGGIGRSPSAQSLTTWRRMPFVRGRDRVAHACELRASLFGERADGRSSLDASPSSPFAVNGLSPSRQSIEVAVHNQKLRDVLNVGAKARPSRRKVKRRHVVRATVACLREQVR